MRVAIRVDSGKMIGSGHLMRCLTLAEQLHKSGADVMFICRQLDGDMIQLVEKKGYLVHRLPYFDSQQSLEGYWEDFKQLEQTDLAQTCDVLIKYGSVDWVVIDHYALSRTWEKGIKLHTNYIWVIDDLERAHECDVLLDQNYSKNIESKYDGLVPTECKKLLGPKFLLLRDEFYNVELKRKRRTGKVKHILIFYSGSDPTNETEKALEAIQLLDRADIQYDVVVGQANPRKDHIKSLCEHIDNVTFHCQVDNMAELMTRADLAIGAGGSATWERCFLGLPALITILADNQHQGVEELATTGTIINLGWYSDVDSKSLYECLSNVIAQPDLLAEISLKARELVGATEDGYFKNAVTSEFWR